MGIEGRWQKDEAKELEENTDENKVKYEQERKEA